MQYIVFDLEFTVAQKKRKYPRPEIVQIGAVKLIKAESGPEIVDVFQTYVYPENGRVPNQETLDFLKIEAIDFVDPQRYTDMIEQFIAWIGETDYYLCTWGDDDRRRIVEQCKHHKMDLEWFRNFNDIQLYYSRLKGNDNSKRSGLANALTENQFTFFGKQHNAMDDAYNTAKLFRTYFDKMTLIEKEYEDIPVTVSEVVYKNATAAEPNTPMAKYANLLSRFMNPPAYDTE